MRSLFSRKKPDLAGVKKNRFREYSEALIVALVLALVIRSFIVQAFKIPSGSMEDTLLIGDHLLVNKFVYGLKIPFTDSRLLSIRDPKAGDVVVFEFPEDEDKSYFQRRDFIKRIIATPGDRVEVRAQKVYVNGQPFVTSHEIHKGQGVSPPSGGPRDYMEPRVVPENSYFVMGDNRDFSYDSRFWGFVDKSKIKGLAFIKYWSWNRLETSVRWSRIGRWID